MRGGGPTVATPRANHLDRPAPRGRDATGNRSTSMDAVLHLQAAAGNHAVSALLADLHRPLNRVAQREAPRDAARGEDKRPEHWNKAPADVGRVRRIPVKGLKLGNRTDFVDHEREKTKESAEGFAVVLVPNGVDPTRPVDVLLHFHGYTSRKSDPYAGWRQDRSTGNVRDVDQDRIEAQLEATASANPQLIAVLPQGVGKSSFGGIQANPSAYIAQVLAGVVAEKQFVAPDGQAVDAAPAVGRLLLSAHSGGGDRVISALGSGSRKQPVEVILFEAIHTSKPKDKTKPSYDAVQVVYEWAIRHLERARRTYARTDSPAERAQAVDACPTLRAYYSKLGTDKTKAHSYVSKYERLGKQLDAWFAQHGSAFETDLPALRARFKVQPVFDADHETIVRGLGDDPEGGPLADALRALKDPEAASTLAGASAPAPAGPAPAGPAPAEDVKQRQAARSLQRAPDPKSPPGFTYRQGVASGYKLTDDERTELPNVSDLVTDAQEELATLKAIKPKDRKKEQRERIAALEVELKRLRAIPAKDEIERTLLEQKNETPATWYSKIVSISFLGVPIKNGVREELATKLVAAEDDLLKTQKLKQEDLGLKAEQDTDGLRPPKLAVGGTKVSLHSYGLAVDLKYKGNPYIGNTSSNVGQVVKRATLLESGTEVNVLATSKDITPREAYNLLKSASDALKAYFKHEAESDLHDKAKARRDAGTSKRSDKEWLKQIAADYKLLNGRGDFNDRDPANGFIDFDVKVIEALTNAGLNWLGTRTGKKDVMHFQLEGVINR